MKKKYTAEEKYQAIAECGNSSIHAVAKKNGIGTISTSTITNDCRKS